MTSEDELIVVRLREFTRATDLGLSPGEIQP